MDRALFERDARCRSTARSTPGARRLLRLDRAPPGGAFWSTLGLALFIGIGIGAASAEQPSGTPKASDTSGEVDSLSSQLEEARDDVAGLQDEVATARDDLSTAEDKLSATRKKLRTARDKASEPAVAPAAPADSGSSSASSGKSFSGNGSKNLGTIVVNEESVLEWTNDDALFTVNDDDYGLSVSSTPIPATPCYSRARTRTSK